MLQSEFTDRTGIAVTSEMYAEIEQQYMDCDLDKDTFCSRFKRKGGMLEYTRRMVREIEELKQQLADEKAKREQERIHAANELSKACTQRNAFEKELVRIHDIEGDHKAIWALHNKIIEKYSNK